VHAEYLDWGIRYSGSRRRTQFQQNRSTRDRVNRSYHRYFASVLQSSDHCVPAPTRSIVRPLFQPLCAPCSKTRIDMATTHLSVNRTAAQPWTLSEHYNNNKAIVGVKARGPTPKNHDHAAELANVWEAAAEEYLCELQPAPLWDRSLADMFSAVDVPAGDSTS